MFKKTLLLIATSALMATLSQTALASEPTYITLPNGAVITVPKWAKTCSYDKLYCPNGWKPDGTFPAAQFRGAFLKALAAKNLEEYNRGFAEGSGTIPDECKDGGLTFSPATPKPDYCEQYNQVQQCVETLQYPICEERGLVVSPAYGPENDYPCYELKES
jgi:hypothetical protein